ncbi:hypothetical protein FISHEDRAFT_58528 [Fistulina hepatica ATCC 64428]|uniref:Uncharacterized protein n=1 Tax=Fistulina hepatica ATCC 64428 TaxID=1128425 RepID=A0A0D7ADS6_9AGAR|nr:hypothetical protein FISHEDRAFT_58528 [Fistulina hepatica ATCC 64428]
MDAALDRLSVECRLLQCATGVPKQSCTFEHRKPSMDRRHSPALSSSPVKSVRFEVAITSNVPQRTVCTANGNTKRNTRVLVRRLFASPSSLRCSPFSIYHPSSPLATQPPMTISRFSEPEGACHSLLSDPLSLNSPACCVLHIEDADLSDDDRYGTDSDTLESDFSDDEMDYSDSSFTFETDSNSSDDDDDDETICDDTPYCATTSCVNQITFEEVDDVSTDSDILDEEVGPENEIEVRCIPWIVVTEVESEVPPDYPPVGLDPMPHVSVRGVLCSPTTVAPLGMNSSVPPSRVATQSLNRRPRSYSVCLPPGVTFAASAFKTLGRTVSSIGRSMSSLDRPLPSPSSSSLSLQMPATPRLCSIERFPDLPGTEAQFAELDCVSIPREPWT